VSFRFDLSAKYLGSEVLGDPPMLSDLVEKRISNVLIEIIPCVDEQERNMLVTFIMSAVGRAVQGDIGRSYEVKFNTAATQLGNAVEALALAKDALTNLDELAREALSRQLMGVLEARDFAPIGTARAWTGMGYIERIEPYEANLSELARQVNLTHEALLVKTFRHGRGAPPKDGPRVVAHHCLLIYKMYIGSPKHPSWNPYTSETSGPLFVFVKAVFEAGGIEASAEDMLKQAIKMERENKLKIN
jgi:hypothetical protein